MIIAGLIISMLASFYFYVVLKRFKQKPFKDLLFAQRLDFFGNILIIVFFEYLGIMFIINNI